VVCVIAGQGFYSTHSEVFSFRAPVAGKRRIKENMEVDLGTGGLTPAQRIAKRLKELNAEVPRAVRV
jgi:hypothetical protein